MKQQMLQRYSDLGERSHMHLSPQVKAYFSEPEEKDDEGKEIITMKFRGNKPKI